MGIILNKIEGLGNIGRKVMGNGLGRTIDDDIMDNAAQVARNNQRFMEDTCLAVGIGGAGIAVMQSDKKNS